VTWNDIDFHPSDRKLRQFAVVSAILLGAFAIAMFNRGHEKRALVAAVIAAIIGLIGAFLPKALRSIFVGLSILSFPIGWTVSWIVLAVVFYCVLTPFALIMRIGGRDPLRLRDQPHEHSLWTVRTEPDDASYFRQF
jgi:FtsH-binding integral membrane protein